MNKKMRKLISKLGLIALVTVGATTSLMAQEVQQPLVSGWAQLDINTIQNYGIIKLEWIEDGMLKTIDEATFNGLSELVQVKLGQIPGATPKNKEILISTTTNGITKKEVLEMLYAMLMSYDYTKELNPDNKDVIAYMTELGIIKGDGKDFALDTPCTEEVAVIMAGRLIEEVYDIFDADSKGVFWKVENNDNTVYMLGAIHFGTTSMYPMSDKIKTAYDESDAVVVEANIYAPIPEEAIQYQYYTDGTTIKDHISEEYYDKLTQVLGKYGITVESLGPIKKSQFTNFITILGLTDTSSSNDPSLAPALGVDKFWSCHNLIEQKKPLLELEGMIYQAKLGDSMGEELANLVFEQVVDNACLGVTPSEQELSANAQMFADWNNYWNTGNVEDLADGLAIEQAEENEIDVQGEEVDKELLAIIKEQSEEYNKAMWETRDTNMTDDIEKMLKAEGSTTYFVTVGAGHYVSDTGIIKQLEERGYTVTQIK